MDDTLEAKIEARKEQAIRRNISEEVANVLELLGSKMKLGGRGNSFSRSSQYVEGSLEVRHLQYENGVDRSDNKGMKWTITKYQFVNYDGRKVFETRNDEVTSYVPGRKWESELSSAHDKAQKIKESRERKEAREKRLQEKEEQTMAKERWGL